MKQITIDRSKRLYQEPHTGHNRWHPDIEPVLEVAPGEEVLLETRDAADGAKGVRDEIFLTICDAVRHVLITGKRQRATPIAIPSYGD